MLGVLAWLAQALEDPINADGLDIGLHVAPNHPDDPSLFVDQTASAFEEMSASINQVATNTESFSSFALQTASSMVEMNATTDEIARISTIWNANPNIGFEPGLGCINRRACTRFME